MAAGSFEPQGNDSAWKLGGGKLLNFAVQFYKLNVWTTNIAHSI